MHRSRCDHAHQSVPVTLNTPAPLQPQWAKELLQAFEEGARDVLGPQAKNDELYRSLEKVIGGKGPFLDDFKVEIRKLVSARMKPGPLASPALAPAPSDCRGPVELTPIKELALPVLDTLGGKVQASPDTGANRWGVPVPNITVEVSPGRVLTVDELVYGYDMVFEAMHLFSYTTWGRVPMQQDPADALAIADLLSRLQPDCFVELGTNTGGGAIFYAEVMQGYHPSPLVITIDVHEPTKNWDRHANKLCPHCVSVTCHPTWNKPGLIKFVQGFTSDPKVVSTVESTLASRSCKRTLVMHDADHRGFSVQSDLQIYHRFVPVGSYLIVQDTKLSRLRGGRYTTMEAVEAFLESPAGKGRFQVDKRFEYLLFSHHHNGFMQRVA